MLYRIPEKSTIEVNQVQVKLTEDFKTRIRKFLQIALGLTHTPSSRQITKVLASVGKRADLRTTRGWMFVYGYAENIYEQKNLDAAAIASYTQEKIRTESHKEFIDRVDDELRADCQKQNVQIGEADYHLSYSANIYKMDCKNVSRFIGQVICNYHSKEWKYSYTLRQMPKTCKNAGQALHILRAAFEDVSIA